jgi:tetratricopeptide (TPR) repeat protein
VLAASYIIVHHLAFASRYPVVMQSSDLAANTWKFVLMIGHFLALGVFPIGLHMRDAISAKVIFVALVIVAMCLAAALMFKEKRRVLLFAMGFFCAALLPYILVVGYFKVFAEHWMYLASYGLFLFMAVVFTGLYTRAKGVARGIVAAILFTAVMFYSFTTSAHNSFWQGSVELSDRVLSASGGDTTAMHFKAVTLLKEGRLDEAKEAMRSYTDQSPRDPRSWYIKGRMLLAAEDKAGAAECFKKAVETDPSYEDGYFGLGLMSLADGKRDEGMALLEKTVRMNPSNSEVLLLLGTIYSETGDDAKALEYTRRAYVVNPYDYNVLVNMGTVHTRMGDIKEGAAYYLKAADLYPEKPIPCYNLGNIFYLSGQKDEAAIWLKKALKSDPNFKPALELLKKMSDDK